MSRKCTTCDKVVGEASYCPYCSQPIGEHKQQALKSSRTKPKDFPIAWLAILASGASIVLPGLALAHRVLTNAVPGPPIRVMYAIATLGGGVMACFGIVLSIVALVRSRPITPASGIWLGIAILCCLAALPVNAFWLLASLWVQ